jgi:hypothetical protein
VGVQTEEGWNKIRLKEDSILVNDFTIIRTNTIIIAVVSVIF